MLRIWGRVTSSNTQKVLWLADELGLTYERIDAGGAAGRLDDPDYRALNPNGLVPTIEDDDFVLWESNTILRYLAAKHRAEAFYPSDLRRRADVERWMDWGSTRLAPAIFPAFLGLVRTPAAQRDEAAIRASIARTAGAFSVLDAHLRTRPHPCGEAPTLADVVLGVNAHRWFSLDFPAAGAARPEMPALRRWYERLAQRPAYQARVMLPLA